MARTRFGFGVDKWSVRQLDLARPVGRAACLGFKEIFGKLVSQLLGGFIGVRRPYYGSVIMMLPRLDAPANLPIRPGTAHSKSMKNQPRDWDKKPAR